MSWVIPTIIISSQLFLCNFLKLVVISTDSSSVTWLYATTISGILVSSRADFIPVMISSIWDKWGGVSRKTSMFKISWCFLEPVM